MMDEKVLTKHPQGKQGVNISKDKYDQMREAVLACLKARPLDHMHLMRCLELRLEGKFEGSIPWYAEAVKLDLEAKRVIERVRTKEAQVYRIKKK